MFKKHGFLFILILLTGCAHYQRVELPPRVDLSQYKSIGIIEFTSSGAMALGPYATKEFIHQIQRAQPGAHFVELGTQEKVLGSLGRHELDLETIKQIGNKFNVDLLAAGMTEISEIKPDFRFSTEWASIKAQANRRVSLSAKLFETASAATLWTDSMGEEWPVVQLGLSSNGSNSLQVSDAEADCEHVTELVHRLTHDFMPRYMRKRIS